MLKKVTAVLLLGLLGFVVGYTSTWLGGHQYHVGTGLWLPRHGQHSPAELVAMTAGHHPGAEVRAVGGNTISVEATGSIKGAEDAVRAAYRAVYVANDGKFQFLPYDHFVEQLGLTSGNPVRRGLLGLLAGVSVALGFLVPPMSLVVRCQRWRLVRCQCPTQGLAMPITLAIAGIAAVATILVLVGFVYAAL